MQFQLRNELYEFVVEVFELAVAHFAYFGLLVVIVLDFKDEDNLMVDSRFVAGDLCLKCLH